MKQSSLSLAALHRIMIRVIAVAMALAPAAVTLAQEAPPSPSLRKTAAPWIGYLLMFVLFAVVVAISLMPSKRSHQD